MAHFLSHPISQTFSSHFLCSDPPPPAPLTDRSCPPPLLLHTLIHVDNKRSKDYNMYLAKGGEGGAGKRRRRSRRLHLISFESAFSFNTTPRGRRRAVDLPYFQLGSRSHVRKEEIRKEEKSKASWGVYQENVSLRFPGRRRRR